MLAAVVDDVTLFDGRNKTGTRELSSAVLKLDQLLRTAVHSTSTHTHQKSVYVIIILLT